MRMNNVLGMALSLAIMFIFCTCEKDPTFQKEDVQLDVSILNQETGYTTFTITCQVRSNVKITDLELEYYEMGKENEKLHDNGLFPPATHLQAR